MKRIISVLLCMVMVFSMLPGGALAAEEATTPVEEPAILSETETAPAPEEPVEAEVIEIVDLLDVEKTSEVKTSDTTEDTIQYEIIETVIIDNDSVDYPQINVTPGMTYEELVMAMKALPEYDDGGLPYEPNCTDLVNTYALSYLSSNDIDAVSEDYDDSPYYDNLLNVGGLQGQRLDIASVAMSQIGYADGSHVNSLAGTSEYEDTSNYSEYGWFFDREYYDWNAMFVSWCARKTGVSTSVIPNCTVTTPGGFGTTRTDFENIRVGDILYLIDSNNNYRVGIVTSVDDRYIYTVEGQRGRLDKVVDDEYPYDDAELVSYVSPNYTNWSYKAGNWYYIDSDTGEVYTGWLSYGSSTYYLDPEDNGRMATGWKTIDGKWYYFRPETNDYGPAGARLSGWVTAGTDNYYYLDPNDNGAMVTGWKTIYSSNYGADKVYYFSTSGVMQTGWLKLSGLWYYLRTKSNDYGPMGSRVTGWKTYDDTYCYLDPNNNGAMVTGWKTISGKTYYFDEDGLMQTSWQEIDGNWYYFASSGAMQTGWCKPASIWFYLDPTTGIMQTGWLYLEDGTYYLSRNESTLGYMVTGWVKISGSWHYFNSSGRMQTGWLDYQDERYYLDPNNNGAALTGTHIIDGVEYTFDEDGALIS